MNLHWWQLHSEHQNIGDYLSTVVVDYMKKVTGVDDECKQAGRKHLYAIGSIIDGGYQNATVWGSGLRRGEQSYWWRRFRKLDLRCVRGPETRRVMMENGYSCPEIYGDPAILMPLIYTPNPGSKTSDYRVVPNHSFDCTSDHLLSPITNDWQGFIDRIMESKLIISSSLHGIILAEVYGVPAVLLNDHDMNLFKYRDYYYSTGRHDFPIAKSVEEALTLDPAPLPDFGKMQAALQASFPADLWQA